MKKKHQKRVQQQAAQQQNTKPQSPRNMLWVLALGGLVLAGGIGFLLTSRGAEPTASIESIRSDSPYAGWVPLLSQKEGFRIYLPAKAQDMYDTVGLANGIDAMWLATHSTGTFSVRVTRCPPKVCQKVPDSILKGFREGAVEELKGTLIEEKRLEVTCPTGTCPGVEFESTSSMGYRVLARLFIVDSRIFQILFMQTGESNEPYRKAVDSFSFL